MESRSPFDVGETVQKGDLIGKVGITGRSSGAHLHLGMATRQTTGARSNHSDVVNPACYLPGVEDLNVSKEDPQTRQGVTATLMGGC
jgi:murein DD-endopeptidase MepM/ murein hydrolase activator NlpD